MGMPVYSDLAESQLLEEIVTEQVENTKTVVKEEKEIQEIKENQ